LQPENSETLFPSNLRLYDPGTSNIMATLGWHKEEGNNHLFLRSENFPKLTIFNDVINLPSNKLFFGAQSDANALGLRYDPGSNDRQPTLTIQAKEDDRWAMRIVQPWSANAPPVTEFHGNVMFPVPESPGKVSYGIMNGSGGMVLVDNTEFVPGDYHNTESSVSAQSVNLADHKPGETNSTLIYAGAAHFSSIPTNQTPSVTKIEGGVVTADEVRTKAWKIPPDYVFEKDYQVRSLEEVERFVKKHKHLPEIPSGKQMQRDGISIGDMHMRMLKTMEEMTLNMIALNKQVKVQQAKNAELEKEIRSLKRAKEGAVK
jgi:hypothetical protein